MKIEEQERYCKKCKNKIGEISFSEWQAGGGLCKGCREKLEKAEYAEIHPMGTKIPVEAGNDCGGFQKPKGHLDTQMFPECEGTETDRNIVKKTVERRKKKEKVAFNLKSFLLQKNGAQLEK